jgi:hypothetical protein
VITSNASSTSEAHHGAAAEREWQCRVRALHGGLRRPSVRAGGDRHADEARERGEHRAGDVRDRAPRAAVVEQGEDQHRHHEHEAGDPLVLPAQERLGAVLDRLHELDHPGVARRRLRDGDEEVRGEPEPGEACERGEIGNGVHGERFLLGCRVTAGTMMVGHRAATRPAARSGM